MRALLSDWEAIGVHVLVPPWHLGHMSCCVMFHTSWVMSEGNLASFVVVRCMSLNYIGVQFTVFTIRGRKAWALLWTCHWQYESLTYPGFLLLYKIWSGSESGILLSILMPQLTCLWIPRLMLDFWSRMMIISFFLQLLSKGFYNLFFFGSWEKSFWTTITVFQGLKQNFVAENVSILVVWW